MVYHIPWIYVPVRSALAIWHQLTKSEIPELAKASVLMRDRSRVETTIQAMHRAGPDALQVISDFDMTLSRFAYNGTRCPTTHNILDNDLLINDACKKRIRELLNIYYPIEIDAACTVEEKLPHMVEWWTSVHELLIQQKIRKDLLALAVEQSSAMLREGYRVFFDHLQQQQVPLLIFSAGVGDILEEGELQAFKGPLIHTFNKREGALLHAAHFRKLRERPNVLLLGDSLGDLTMADGLAHTQHTLTVGFLNDQVGERRESYINSYDIVLVKDETMDVPNAILNYIAPAPAK
ncbi:7-methylguanosine phosphate-specific 5'-nucleotidase isoform X2 [Esox lucius]|uniref:7-methylguanosine phosphate-specific 5'-nucleotidase isoform X2 n=1 Tax=Esox lucius TaxID=8010 RepID=UPI001476ED9B|nr:7-methylguanosine phosphate-specific 5'-nucleotidase isoform X2 [Esox lucius]